MITRIIIYAILFYLLFLFLRFLMRLYITYTKGKSVSTKTRKKMTSRLDLDDIEDADFEEVKKQRNGEKN